MEIDVYNLHNEAGSCERDFVIRDASADLVLATIAARSRDRAVIVAGDYNSPSHLDWSEKTKGKHKGLIVPWPVSSAMAGNGYIDAFRAIHPNPAKVVARTWSPRFTDSYQMRIDYVYYRGRALRPTAARMIDQHKEGWPSDHAAVLVAFDYLRPK